jgi:hypothetical protein
VRAGIRTFFRRPVALTGLFFMFMAALSLVAIVPVVGGIVALVLVPAFTVGLMDATRGRRRALSAARHPVRGLSPGAAHARAMLWVGALYALAVLCVVGVSALIDGGQFAQMYVGGGGGLSAERMEDPRFLAALWVSTLLYLPVSLAFWYAPALVHWYGVTPAKSLFFSVVAVLRNARAFLVYGLLWTALSLGVGLLMLVLLMTTSHSDIALATMAMFPLRWCWPPCSSARCGSPSWAALPTTTP